MLRNTGIDLPPAREQLKKLLYESLITSPRQVVLNIGPFGSGKTSAVRFFCSREQLLSMIASATVPHVKDVYALYVPLPQNPEHAGQAILRSIVNAIGFDNLRKVVRDLIVEHGQKQALCLIQESGAGETLGKAIWLMGLEPQHGQLVPFQGEPPQSTYGNLLRSYFLSSNVTRSHLKMESHQSNDRGFDMASASLFYRDNECFYVTRRGCGDTARQATWRLVFS